LLTKQFKHPETLQIRQLPFEKLYPDKQLEHTFEEEQFVHPILLQRIQELLFMIYPVKQVEQT
jgi:hypothetical protein